MDAMKKLAGSFPGADMAGVPGTMLFSRTIGIREKTPEPILIDFANLPDSEPEDA